jgi:zinc ribbon protein
MEVRCGSCNKLFRVSNDKITGKGIKFTCTRCGEYVKITREAFEDYTLAQFTVSALDVFEPKASPPARPVPAQDPAAVGITASVDSVGAESGVADVIGSEQKTDELPTSPTPDFLQEREETPSSGSSPFEDSSQMTELQPPHEQTFSPGPVQDEMRVELENEPSAPVEPESQPEAVIAAEPKKEPVPEPEIRERDLPESGLKSEQSREPTPEQKPTAKQEDIAGLMTGAAGQGLQAKPAATAVPVMPGVSIETPQKEHVRPSGPLPQKAVKAATPAETVRSGSFMRVLLVAFVILGLGGVGAYLYLRSSPSAKQESQPGMVSAEGLQIVNAVGSLQENGDLLVSGELENTTDRPRDDWYIVVDVLDATGAVLHKIRMLNGKQIYTRSDYEILAKRGANVQDLKEKALQPHGVVLPPKGKAAFEMRYLQPPASIASFNATLQPFDPALLLKEITEDTK